MLLIEADHHLGLDGAVPQPRDDRLLDFRYGSTRRRNFAGVGNVNASLLVDGLRWQVNEVPGPRASGLPRREQSAWSGLEDRHVENVANTDHLIRLRPFVRELAGEGDQIGLGEETDGVLGNVDQGVRQRRRGTNTSGGVSIDRVAGRSRTGKQSARWQQCRDTYRQKY